MAEITEVEGKFSGYVKRASSSVIGRIATYSIARLLTMFITVVIGIYLTIMIANMGGYVDTIMRSEIRERINQTVLTGKIYQDMAPEARKKIAEDLIAVEERRLHLDVPVAIRSFNYLTNALKLELGRATNMTSDNGSRTVRLILLERLPATLLLMGTSQLFLFFSSVYFALSLSRSYGGWLDRLVISLTPTSAAPSWFYGVFFILIFAAILKVLPFGGMVDAPPPEGRIEYGLSVLKHLILPCSALVISSFFISIYSWRTFFLIYSSEDYVEMAKAKGLSSRDIETQYILRPTLPNIITNFALIIITLWTGAIVTEAIFLWPGLGITLFRAVELFDIPVIVGSTIIFAYLQAITFFLLDFVYVLVDPRVKIGGQG
jgi:peptide/nickel transport system permease protein